jgi:hypothetical protein
MIINIKKLKFKAQSMHNDKEVIGGSIIQLKDETYIIESDKEVRKTEHACSNRLLGISSIYIHKVYPETVEIFEAEQ